MSIFKLPDLGEGLPDAEIHEWHVKEGDVVAVDQLLVSMETAKAVVDVPAPQGGTIKKLYGAPGDVIQTGQPLVEFESTGAVATPSPSTEENSHSAATVAGRIEVGNTILQENAMGISQSVGEEAQGLKTLPLLRLLATRLGIDIHGIPTSHPRRLTLEDFARFLKQSMGHSKTSFETPHEKTTVPGEVTPLRGVRKLMAQSMAKSHEEVVPVTIMDEADLHAWPQGTDITVRLIRAIIKACEEEPALNAYFDGARLGTQRHEAVHLGIALDAGDGLFVPVIRDANTQSPESLRNTLNRFKEEVKNRSISPQELLGPTITLSNFGMFAGRFANPIIVPPMVAIIAAGRLREAVVPFQGKPAIHRVLPLSLTFDHRAATGGEATRFLGILIKDLESAS